MSILPAASERLIESRRTPALADIDIRRLYRAFLTPANSDWRRPELTAFVEAATHNAAVRKIGGAVAALEYRKLEEVAERIYNCPSGAELIEEGLSEEYAMRRLKTGYRGGRPTHFVRSPLVLLPDPGPLLRIWAAIPQEAP